MTILQVQLGICDGLGAFLFVLFLMSLSS